VAAGVLDMALASEDHRTPVNEVGRLSRVIDVAAVGVNRASVDVVLECDRGEPLGVAVPLCVRPLALF
jgi:hypothetical protein